MIIGFIGFGRVSLNLTKLIRSDDITFITSFEGRSPETIENIKKSDVEVLNSFDEVSNHSDILISANSPEAAPSVAEKYAEDFKGIYLDLNNVSPKTTFEIKGHVENLVDGAVIGKIDSQNPILYLAGEKSDELLFLNDFIETKKISNEIGDASLLKMLRSSYTKTLSVLLIESAELAKSQGLEEEFFEVLSLSEGETFTDKSKSRIINTLNSSKRKSEELDEIINYFTESELTMVKAALKKLKQL